jgi:Ca-activated chloride channel homolog
MSFGASAMWDAVVYTCENIRPRESAGAKRVIILISHGYDNFSKIKRDEAIERAAREGVRVYAIGMGDEYFDGVNKGPRQKLAEQTGGRAFFPKTDAETEDALAEIKAELPAQYAAVYSPAGRSNNQYRKVKIEFADPEKKKEKLTLTYRAGYYPAVK